MPLSVSTLSNSEGSSAHVWVAASLPIVLALLTPLQLPLPRAASPVICHDPEPPAIVQLASAIPFKNLSMSKECLDIVMENAGNVPWNYQAWWWLPSVAEAKLFA